MTSVPSHVHHRPTQGILRVREPGEHTPVTTFELFFDLVFVFAVTQLSHLLAEHLTLEGTFQMLLLMLAVWWVWVYTTWATNWVDPNHLTVRLMLLAVMLAGLVMSAAIPGAFGSHGLVFAASLAAIQVGRTSFMLWAVRNEPLLRRTFQRIVLWFCPSAVLWIAGGLAEGDARGLLWAAAVALEYMGPFAAYWVPGFGRVSTSDWAIEGSHMAERCGLFVIIALGESLLVTGATFSGLDWTAHTITALVGAFATSVAMWWIYFDVTAEMGTRLIGHADDPGRVARLAYTYIHLPIVAGIIITAVGDEIVLAHPTGEATMSTAMTVVGGPAVFLAGYVLFKWAITGKFYVTHAFAFLALGVLFAAHALVTPVALTVGSTSILVALAARTRLASHPAEFPEIALPQPVSGRPELEASE